MLGLSERFVVYDTVSMTTTFAIEIDDRFTLGKSRMAVNSRSGVVAVSVSERDTRTPSRLILLNVNDLGKKPVLEEQVNGQIHVLLAKRDKGGFLIIDGEGRTSSVSPPGPAGMAGAARDDIPEKALVRSGLENVFGTGTGTDTGRKEGTALGIKPGVVDGAQRANLEDVFRFESTARAPGASELFRQVALVVSGAAA